MIRRMLGATLGLLMLWAAPPAEAGWLGVSLQGPSDSATGQGGAMVVTVAPGSPAAGAGLQPGDIILAVQGRAAQGAQEVAAAIRALPPGSRLQLEVVRAGQRLALTVTLGAVPAESPTAANPPAAPPPSAAAPPSSAAPFTTWREPREGAFTLSVPRGWVISGGVHRNGPVDVRPFVQARSPDGHITVFLDDPDILPRQVPNALMQQAGVREGQILQGGAGPILVARYRTGVQFAQEYIAWKLCRQPRITDARPLPDQTNEMNARIVPLGRSQGTAAEASVGEAAFRCGDTLGYAYATTIVAGPAMGPGVQVWAVYKLAGFLASNPAQAGWANYVLDVMLGSFLMEPQWEARVMQQAQDATGAITRMQRAMGETIARHASQQASAGGLNHPNPGVPWNLRDKWKHEAGPRQAFSNAITGNKYVCDASWGCRQVDNQHTHHWINNEGKVVSGPESGYPPDYSGQWRQMSPARP